MKKNTRRTRKMSVITKCSARIGAVMLMLFVMVIFNVLARSNCTQLMKSIGEKERRLASLENERQRESARWDKMRSPDRLESTLPSYGLAMHYPKPAQIVMMNANGQPRPGQFSLARLTTRSSAVKTVRYSSARR